MNNKEQFAEIMAKLVIAFNVQASAARTSIYWDELGDYSIDRIRRAASAAIQTCRMFPSVSELIGLLPPPEQPVALTEPPPTQEELTYGQWQCRFALWLMGKQKIGEKKVRTRYGYKMQSIYRETRPRWQEAESQKGRQKLWDEFCQRLNVPERVANVPIN